MRGLRPTWIVFFALAGLAVVLAAGAVVASGITGPNGVTATPGRGFDSNGFYTSPVTIEFTGSEPADTCAPAQDVYSGADLSSTCTSAADPAVTYSDTFGTTEFPYDDDPPEVDVPDDITEEATSAGGAVVVFDGEVNAEGGPDPTCTPKDSGELFPIDTTTVTCSSTDAAGNSDSESFDVTVQDTREPAFGPTPDVTIQANHPDGYVSPQPAYALPTATDVVDGPGVSVDCDPGAGADFDFGATEVECTASDARGNSASEDFTVTVIDTLPPEFGIQPQDIVVQARNEDTGSPATDPCIQEFLNAPTANDDVDGAVSVSHDAPEQFPIGATTVTFTASDSRGNDADPKTAVVSVRRGPQGPCTVDARAPGNVKRVQVREGSRLVVIRWTKPRAADLANTRIYRKRDGQLGLGQQVYRGMGQVFRDRKVRNDVKYVYVIRTFDEAGNHRPGVARRATPHRILLLRPRDGAVIFRPPTFDWVRKARADYYNFQLHRMVNGELRQVLSRWPTASSFKLTRTWRFEDRRYRFVPGRYFWYVWPGFGPRSQANYGDLMGSNSFRVKRR